MIEQHQGDDPRGVPMTNDPHRVYCSGCGEWRQCETDHEHDDLCRECWEIAYPSISFGEDTEPVDYSEEETVVGIAKALGARGTAAARGRRSGGLRGAREGRKRDRGGYSSCSLKRRSRSTGRSAP